jgi:hypothetical protein
MPGNGHSHSTAQSSVAQGAALLEAGRLVTDTTFCLLDELGSASGGVMLSRRSVQRVLSLGTPAKPLLASMNRGKSQQQPFFSIR